MADAPDVTRDEFEEIMLLRVDEIDASERMRPVDPVWAKALGAIIAADGQLTPIEVCKLPGRGAWTLVTGAHRLAGMASEGIGWVRAIAVSSNRAERRLREVSENLWRKGLDPIDRAAFVAELVALKQVAAGVDPARDGRAVSAAVRWDRTLKEDANDANCTMQLAYGWADDVAAGLHVSRDTIFRDLMLHRRLLPDVAAALRGHPIASNGTQLRALAKLDPAPQRALAEILVAGAKSVSEAVVLRDQVVKPSVEDKRQSALLGSAMRMGRSERAGAFKLLAYQHTEELRAALAYVDANPQPPLRGARA